MSFVLYHLPAGSLSRLFRVANGYVPFSHRETKYWTEGSRLCARFEERSYSYSCGKHGKNSSLNVFVSPLARNMRLEKTEDKVRVTWFKI